MSFSKSPKLRTWFLRLIIICLTIVVGLLLCEIGVRVIAPQALSGTWSEGTSRGGIVNKANWTVRHQLYDRVLHYRFNDLRLRGGPAGNSTNRVLVIGDSFTFGWLVEETNIFISKFNALAAKDFPANSFEFLNGGTAGWGTADYVAFVEDYAPQIKPSAIVVFLNNDDIERSVRAGLYALDASNAIVAVKHETIAAGTRDRLRNSKIYQWALEHLELVQICRNAFQLKVIKHNVEKTAAAHGGDDSAFGVQLVQGLFLRLQSWCTANHCQLIVMTTGYNAFPDFPLGWDDGQANRKFFDAAPEFFATNHFNFHDLGPELFAVTHGDYKQAVIPKDFHPDERGHQMLADLAWPWLKPQLQLMLSDEKHVGSR